MFEGLGDSIFPREVFKIFGISISDSALSGFIVVAFVGLLALMIRLFVIPRFKNNPGGFQMLLEWLVNTFDNMSKEMTGKLSKFLGPYTFGASAYIFFGVCIEIFGFRPVIADINACIALALCTFVLINTMGIKEKGVVGRVKYYFKPVAFIAPIKVVTDAAVPVSMTFRLFGSILSGLVMTEMLYSICRFVLPAIGIPFFTLFHAFIQSYVFSALSLTFIAEATE